MTGSVEPVPPRIRRMLDERRLRPAEPDEARVASLWQKALDSLRDSRNADNAPDNRYSMAYQAVLQMALAVLAAAGYQTRGGGAHHFDTFYAVADLGIPGLERIDARTEVVRAARAAAVYEATHLPDEERRALDAAAVEWFRAARAWLIQQRPSSSRRLGSAPAPLPDSPR